jgi:uncharacterized RDD family membrane protein YckC
MTIGEATRAYGGVGERVARRTSVGGLILRRWFGCWIDFIAIILLVALPALVLRPFGPPGAGVVVVGFVLVLLYFPITEGLWGRSLGKLVSGTIVVDVKGRPPGFTKAIVRTLLRLIEVNPFLLGGIPAGIVAANTKAHQRIGDLLAGTYVVPIRELEAAKAGGDGRDLQALANEFS